jgi:hypothetical protein
VRDFLYLDPVLGAETLSQVDFGLVKELQETVERASGKEGGLAISAFGLTDIGGKGQRSDRTASEVVLGATVESYASRLLVRLEETKQLVRLGRESEIDDLRRGTVIVAEAELEEPGAPSSGRWELVTGSESAGTAGGRRDATESEPAETLGNDTAGRWTTTERWATESDSPVFAGGPAWLSGRNCFAGSAGAAASARRTPAETAAVIDRGCYRRRDRGPDSRRVPGPRRDGPL